MTGSEYPCFTASKNPITSKKALKRVLHAGVVILFKVVFDQRHD